MLEIQQNNFGEMALASTFDLFVFRDHVENDSDGWVFDNTAYPTKESDVFIVLCIFLVLRFRSPMQ